MADTLSESLQFTDRYEALGIHYPDPETVCVGQCEGTGFVPVADDDDEEPFRSLADDAHRSDCSVIGGLRLLLRNREWWFWKSKLRRWRCDGWHFVRCPDCAGSGKRAAPEEGRDG